MLIKKIKGQSLADSSGGMAAGVTAGTLEEDLAPGIKKKKGEGGEKSAMGKKNENWRQKD